MVRRTLLWWWRCSDGEGDTPMVRGAFWWLQELLLMWSDCGCSYNRCLPPWLILMAEAECGSFKVSVWSRMTYIFSTPLTHIPLTAGSALGRPDLTVDVVVIRELCVRACVCVNYPSIIRGYCLHWRGSGFGMGGVQYHPVPPNYSNCVWVAYLWTFFYVLRTDTNYRITRLTKNKCVCVCRFV